LDYHISKFKTIALSLLLLTPIWLKSNSEDSLLKVLPSLSGKAKVDALNELVWEYKYSNKDKALKHAMLSIDIASKLAYFQGIAEAQYNLGVTYYVSQSYDSSVSFLERSILNYQKVEDIIGIARSWNIIGLNYLSIGDNREALEFFKKALHQFEVVNNVESILKVNANIGNVYYRMGAFDTALVAYNQIVEYAKEVNDQQLLANNLQNIGMVYSEYGQYAKALQTYFDVRDILDELKDSIGLPNTLHSIAYTYNRLKMYEEGAITIRDAIRLDRKQKKNKHLGTCYITLANAMKGLGFLDSSHFYNKKALELFREVGYQDSSMVYINLGMNAMLNESYEEAENYFIDALKTSEAYNRFNVEASAKYNLAKLYIVTNQKAKAEPLLLEAFNYWNETNMYRDLSSVSEELYKLYREFNKLDLAIHYEQMYNGAKDSVFGQEKQIEVMRVLIQKELSEQKQIVQKLEEGRSADHSIIYWLSGLLVLLFGGIFYRLNFKKMKTIKSLQEDLNNQGRELAFTSLTAIQKDKFIAEFAVELEPLVNQYPENESLQALNRSLNIQKIQVDHWMRFKTAFEQIVPHFFDHLLNKYPKLTETDLRICALIRLAIPSKEIAIIFGVSAASVNKARYRLRKRLGISNEEKLDQFLLLI